MMMKKFILRNSKLLMVSSVIIIALVLITLMSVSYAIGGSTLYTRDEVSEIINNLQNDNDELNKVGSRITLIMTSSTIVESADDLPIIPFAYSVMANQANDIFAFENNIITIKKRGNYVFQLNTNMLFSSIGASYNFVVRKNDSVDLSYAFSDSLTTTTEHCNFSDYYSLNVGDQIFVKFATTSKVTMVSLKANITYLGSN